MNAHSISFATFMQEALYDLEHGYYASGRAQIGKQGDFYTNVSVGKIYGKVLALFFQDLWEKLGKPHSFTIVEQGAHDGRLALDILETLQGTPDFFECTHYCIVEPLSSYQQRQHETLQRFKNISWVNEVMELPEFEGISFSNELLDAFPIHLLTWNGNDWLEKRVASDGEGHFSWVTAPLTEKALQEIAEHLPRDLAPGFLWEARLGITPWLQEIETRMKRGLLLIADYGYAGADRFAPYRADGSIACYQNHRRYDNPLEKPGERDITAHVDFTAVAQAAILQGWDVLGFSDQHHFLTAAAEKWLRSLEGKIFDPLIRRDIQSLQTLLHPETMGRQFQFLGLGKKMETIPTLDGFRYQRPGIKALSPSTN